MQNAVARRHCEECVLVPETLTNRHAIGLVGMEQSRFQDRCLKPLGHPSSLATSLLTHWPWQTKVDIAAESRRRPPFARPLFGPDLS